MLEQVLQNMFIEPELLAEMAEEDKQVLFYEMRREQIRRYNQYEKEHFANEEPTKSNSYHDQPKVSFRAGADGHEWVWVMGEHQNDKSIEEILQEEEIQKATQLAQEELERMEMNKSQPLAPSISTIVEEGSLEIVPEKNLVGNRKKAFEPMKEPAKSAFVVSPPVLRASRSSDKDVQRQALINRRSSEILQTFQEIRSKFENIAQEQDSQLERTWRQREARAKQAEKETQCIARLARARASLVGASPVLSPTVQSPVTSQSPTAPTTPSPLPPPTPPHVAKYPQTTPTPPIPPHVMTPLSKPPALSISSVPQDLRPPSRHEAILWFRSVEIPRGSVLQQVNSCVLAPWFHGIISREHTESLLEGCAPHTFLVRVSERIYGYVVSYRGLARVKHVLVGVQPPWPGKGGASDVVCTYQALGTHTTPTFQHLRDLVDYYKMSSISSIGEEFLSTPLRQCAQPPDYSELFELPPNEEHLVTPL